MAYVLAGGRGSRLMELTDRPRQAGGLLRRQEPHHRLRAVQRAELRHPADRRRHPVQGAQPDPPPAARLELLPARAQRELRHPARQPARRGDPWYAGTADAVFQNIDIIESYAPHYIVLLAGDHIYKMDYEPMLQQHVEQGADVTVGCIEVPRDGGDRRSASCTSTSSDRIISFLEKPADPPAMPGEPDMALASMGIYVFETSFLFDELRRDAADPNSSHDFGKDIIPASSATARRSRTASRSPASAPRGGRPTGATSARWMPTGRPTSTSPTSSRPRPVRPRLADLDLCRDHAAGQVRARRDRPARHGGRSLVSGGCIVSGASLRRSLLFTGVHVHSYCSVERAVILPYADIGRVRG